MLLFTFLQEIDELVEDWTPEPLVAPRPVLSSDENTLETLPVILGPTGARVKLAANPSKQVLNLASTNFTGLAEDERMKESALGALRKYGVGSCGPPGFYGTFGSSSRFADPAAPARRRVSIKDASVRTSVAIYMANDRSVSIAAIRCSPAARAQFGLLLGSAERHHLRSVILVHLVRHPSLR